MPDLQTHEESLSKPITDEPKIPVGRFEKLSTPTGANGSESDGCEEADNEY